MSDEQSVIKFIEKVGVSEAARVLGIARPTCYVRLKNPESVTMKELKIVQGLSIEAEPETPEDDRQYVPRVPKNPNPMPKDPEPVVEAQILPETRFRPSTFKSAGAPGLTMESLNNRLIAVEEYLKIVSQNQNLISGKATVGEAVVTPRPAFQGEHPLAQLHRAGNPQDNRRPPQPTGIRVETDSGWNDPKQRNNR